MALEMTWVQIQPRHSKCCRMSFFLLFLIAPPCNDSEVRIVVKNRVQICHDEMWGYVCGNREVCGDMITGWNNNAAKVVCKETGFSHEG